MVEQTLDKRQVTGSIPVRRTMAKQVTASPTAYQVVYKGEETTSIWTYDKSKFKHGPISVEIQYHDGLVERGDKKKKKATKKKK